MPAPANTHSAAEAAGVDGRSAKLEIVGYFCHGPQPGCLTFCYVYQGNRTTTVAP